MKDARLVGEIMGPVDPLIVQSLASTIGRRRNDTAST